MPADPTGTQSQAPTVSRRSRVDAIVGWLEQHREELEQKDKLTLTFHCGLMDVQAELVEKHKIPIAA